MKTPVAKRVKRTPKVLVFSEPRKLPRKLTLETLPKPQRLPRKLKLQILQVPPAAEATEHVYAYLTPGHIAAAPNKVVLKFRDVHLLVEPYAAYFKPWGPTTREELQFMIKPEAVGSTYVIDVVIASGPRTFEYFGPDGMSLVKVEGGFLAHIYRALSATDTAWKSFRLRIRLPGPPNEGKDWYFLALEVMRWEWF